MNRTLKQLLVFWAGMALLLAWAGGALGLDPETAYQKAKGRYLDLQASSRKQMYRENWTRVIEDFVGIAQAWPDHRRAADALYMAGKSARGLYRISRIRDDARLAVRYFDRLVAEYPRSRLADDALFQAGAILEKTLDDRAQAYVRYSRIVRRYPRGDMFPLAKPRLHRLAAFAPAQPERTVRTDGTPRLERIRDWSDGGRTRIVFDLSADVRYDVHYLPGKGGEEPDKLFFDIRQAEVGEAVASPLLLDKGLVARIRTGSPQTGVLRVVFDLRQPARHRVFTLDDPFRIVADLTPAEKGTAPAASVAAPPGDDLARILESNRDTGHLALDIPERREGQGLRRIVVDAGHGGKDPGAIGPGGTKEKDVTLALAKKLARELETRLGCEVILTRDRDIFIPLEERTAIANRLNADLFISIHANASPNRKAYGIETYYLNFSKNKDAVAVAARENNTSLQEVGDLELILFDLMANSKINESSRLATEIQSSIIARLRPRYSRIKNLGVRPGPFYVLLGATMPSVLVETAFISNPKEERRLRDATYQKRTARAIVEGVRRYARALNLLAVK